MFTQMYTSSYSTTSVYACLLGAVNTIKKILSLQAMEIIIIRLCTVYMYHSGQNWVWVDRMKLVLLRVMV